VTPCPAGLGAGLDWVAGTQRSRPCLGVRSSRRGMGVSGSPVALSDASRWVFDSDFFFLEREEEDCRSGARRKGWVVDSRQSNRPGLLDSGGLRTGMAVSVGLAPLREGARKEHEPMRLTDLGCFVLA
jgi:hypothetical protein